MSAELRDRLFRYCFALFCTAFAAWTRHLCEPALHGHLPLGFFMLAVALTCWLAGPAPALLALLLGALAAAHVAMPPIGSLAVEHSADWLALLVYLIGGSLIIGLFHRLASQQQAAACSAEENEQLVKKLLVADRRRHDYLALLAHELRNPLAPLQTGLEILRRGDGTAEDSTRLLTVMSRQLDHVTRLLDDLLDVTRFAKGQIRFHRQVLDLRCAVRTAVESVQPHLVAFEHEFQCVMPETPVWIRGDRVRLVQIVSNLLSNAAKYTPQGGNLKLIVAQCEQHAFLSVHDDGLGIALADQQRIFELFTQVDGARIGDAQGLGIGLSLVRQLVKAHKGTISVHSDGAGRGSTFEVRLPLVDQQQAPDSLSESAICGPEPIRAGARLNDESAATAPRRDNGPQRVLIVDDNEDAAETLASLLSFEGLAVQVAHNGMTALRTLEQFTPEIVLLDIGMPEMDGFEVAKQIRSRTMTQPRILAVSGWGGEECERLAREAGIDEHWLKPIDPAAMVNRLSQFRGGDATDHGIASENATAV
ncbi:MAG: histidine kinase [Planctomycetaceae bacterium]|nr:histidine kinase [Planctomycetaceae bacterium]